MKEIVEKMGFTQEIKKKKIRIDRLQVGEESAANSGLYFTHYLIYESTRVWKHRKEKTV